MRRGGGGGGGRPGGAPPGATPPPAARAQGGGGALGLVSTKWVRLETVEELESRLHEAARYHPLELLALSPQCGFASAAVPMVVSAPGLPIAVPLPLLHP